MQANVQSISEIAPVTTPSIDGPEQQGTLQVAWKLSDRIAWAMGLKVAPTTKLVAVAIAQRAGASSGLAWPGMGTLAADTGRSRSSVIRAVKELEQGGHLSVTRLRVGSKNVSNRYRLPAMNGSTVAPPSVRVTPPPSVMVTPEPVRTFESVKKAAAAACISSTDTEKPKAETVRPDRHTCPKCNNDWPIRFGTKCFSCNGQRSTALGAVRAPPGKYDGLWEADATSVAPADSELTPVKSTPSVARHTLGDDQEGGSWRQATQ